MSSPSFFLSITLITLRSFFPPAELGLRVRRLEEEEDKSCHIWINWFLSRGWLIKREQFVRALLPSWTSTPYWERSRTRLVRKIESRNQSMSHVAYEWVMPHTSESCHIWMSCVTHEWAMSHMNESRLVRRMMLGLTPQQIVTMKRVANGALGNGRNVALEITKGVMGRVAWEHYSNSKYKEMTGACKPAGCTATTKKNQARKELLGDSWKGLTLQTLLHYFQDVDTKWIMDTELVWLSPERRITFSNTLGDMISEAFHANYRKKLSNGTRTSKHVTKLKNTVSTGTSCEATQWEADTGMNVNKSFFGSKK